MKRKHFPARKMRLPKRAIRGCSLRTLLPAVLFLLPAVAMQSAVADTEYIQVAIEFGDGAEKSYTQITPRVDLTVLGALEAVARHPRGVEFSHRGSGRTAFVTAIDGLANEGGSGDARNWRYYLNGRIGNQGAGAQAIAAGDRILWKFEGSE